MEKYYIFYTATDPYGEKLSHKISFLDEQGVKTWLEETVTTSPLKDATKEQVLLEDVEVIRGEKVVVNSKEVKIVTEYELVEP